MHTGMLPPTEAGAYEIGQLTALKESLTGPDPAAGRGETHPMLAYAIALDAAQPWLDDSVSAPPWFGSGEVASLRASDLDVAYHGFMSAPEWGLSGRSEDGADAAADPDDEVEREFLSGSCPNWRRRTASRLKGWRTGKLLPNIGRSQARQTLPNRIRRSTKTEKSGFRSDVWHSPAEPLNSSRFRRFGLTNSA